MVSFHHVEIWLEHPAAELLAWRWLLDAIGLTLEARWDEGESWATAEDGYLTLTASPNTRPGGHDRRRPGVNHVAFALGEADAVDAVKEAAPDHGWQPLYQERYPWAGGPDHYAGWLENAQGFKIELVAERAPRHHRSGAAAALTGEPPSGCAGGPGAVTASRSAAARRC